MRTLDRITVFTGSAAGARPEYAAAAEALGRELAARGIGVVYGGGKVGLMGTVADAALAAGGEVDGVIPQVLVSGEVAHEGLTRLDVVETMHARKERMAELGDAFVALPGGAGTLEELFEVWTWQQLGIHAKPVALYDVDGFWNPLLALLEHMVAQGFLAPGRLSGLIVASDPGDLLERLAAWEAPVPKWSRGAPEGSGKDSGAQDAEGRR